MIPLVDDMKNLMKWPLCAVLFATLMQNPGFIAWNIFVRF